MVTHPPTDPGRVLFGATRRKLLGWLFGHPDESFYLRELLRQTGTPVGAAQRELAILTAAGILTRERRGNQVFFQANRASQVFPELSSLVTKTTGVAAVIRDALRPLTDRIAAAFIHGSAARNELRQESDVDVVIVGDVSFGEIVDVLRSAEAALGREVNATVYPRREFVQKVQSNAHFVSFVLRAPTIFVVGDAHDLERLGADGQVADRPYDHEAGNPRPGRGRRAKPARQRRHRS